MGNLVQAGSDAGPRQTILILNFGFHWLKCAHPSQTISFSSILTFGGLSFSAQAIAPSKIKTQNSNRKKEMNLHPQSNDLENTTIIIVQSNFMFRKMFNFFLHVCWCMCQTSFIRWLHPLKWLHFFFFDSLIRCSLDWFETASPLFFSCNFEHQTAIYFVCIYVHSNSTVWSMVKFEYFVGTVNGNENENGDTCCTNESERMNKNEKKSSLMLAANASCPMFNILPTKIYVPKLSQ